jgi:ornithine cyclodeaminase
MSLLFTISDLQKLLKQVGVLEFFKLTIENLREDFANWNNVDMIPRVATHYPHGVIELMPASTDEYYGFKYVNGHPNNPAIDKLTVTAVGMLAEVASGYPLLISEMTVLTAFRTAATSALASRYLAIENTKDFGIIGTGSQAEFQVLAHLVELGIERVYYYDIDPQAMQKFTTNMQDYDIQLVPCASAEEVCSNSQILTTATADKTAARILSDAMIHKGMHINGIGGDCPGKTEIDINLLKRSKIVVEFIEQSMIEGEIQNLTQEEVYAELWELVSDKKPGRENVEEVTLFDSVGVAIEDYSILKLVYELAQKYNLGEKVDMLPELSDPKNLFTLVK